MSLSLSMDFPFKTSIEKLWLAITDSNQLAKWITENDFKPVVGHRFQFRHEPSEWWDGIVEGEVLIVDEPNLLSYTWATGEERHTVTLTLQDLGGGKVNLHLEQIGFSNVHGLEGAKHGWSAWVAKLEKALAD
ncbi:MULTISPECIES: SRPBCC domain-containing protein [Paenibacillus]|uniref:SRPBCC family protein n=1 Tax=Paenibacillus TaxID=44249 RepID=UPI000BBD9CB7|nr:MULTISPECIES: SRPBCC domain-containing protein [Paenibacillus]PCL93398.1 ATPase [Paenibacillus lautus]QOT12001.1 SRPBCC domain-containing protein [Paenibacillus sp. JNUCC-32]WFB55915.1 SRPBCC domain-containing protein [Paenibacillus sp. BR1-192]GIP03505.1 activator of HSP90 ATPase [Paenibacillus lautus]